MLALTMTRARHATLALCLLFALALSAALPGAALAELSSGHIIENANKQSEEEAAKQSATSTTAEKEKERESSQSLPGGLVLLGVGAAVILLGGIAFVVVRDARSHAPIPEGGPGAVGSSSRVHSESHLRRRRAKAKAARQQRKRNR